MLSVESEGYHTFCNNSTLPMNPINQFWWNCDFLEFLILFSLVSLCKAVFDIHVKIFTFASRLAVAA